MLLVMGFLHAALCFQGCHVSTSFPFMTKQHYIVWMGHICLSTHLLMGIWVVSTLLLL